MQFVPDGPDIPDSLLQAHEEGRVVFFCGAGISYPAGLPDFRALVERIYILTGARRTAIEDNAFDHKQYDATLELLERRLPGQWRTLRRALAQALKPNLRRKGATETHNALLRLAHDRQGSIRLVTTNFDSLFHTAARRTRQKFQTYAAPMLPSPKKSRWNGLVFLHGLLPKDADDTALKRLVVTSGDFGQAYLVERWAAQFASELFRNYVVCFVGYSINDPVLRYMMDALAADRMLGEVTPQAWALGACKPGDEESTAEEWEAKGVTPILYTVPTDSDDHSKLHQTLHTWADVYSSGVQGKEAIVTKHALTRPQASTSQDDFVGRMLWALSDPSGLPAQRFADFNPAPSLDWLLEAFSDGRFNHGDLPRFAVLAHASMDENLQFSLVRRPAPPHLAPWMMLASPGSQESGCDDVMDHLARWLTRHLDDPRLIIWIAKCGGQIHSTLAWRIERALNALASQERKGKSQELEEIRANSPKAIPGPLMRLLWRLLLSGRVRTANLTSAGRLGNWRDRWQRDGLTATLRLELRGLLAPKVTLRAPWHLSDDTSPSAEEPKHLGQLVDWELVLASDHVRSLLLKTTTPEWKSALPQLLEDLQQLLRDALDLLAELMVGDSRPDPSYWALPSIQHHWQNRGYHEWVTLIELFRDSWLAVRAIDTPRAIRVARYWFTLPYPTFKRLALFAASHDDTIASEEWVTWLLEDEALWLWSLATKREKFRLLVQQGKYLAGMAQEALEAAILAGPLRKLYPDDWTADQWQYEVDRTVWLHLAKLRSSELVLGEAAEQRLESLSLAYPHWELARNERDEFSHWMSGTGDPDFEEYRDRETAPRTPRALVQWLKVRPPKQRPFYEDDWREVCRTRLSRSLCALSTLAQGDEWPEERWRDALQVWAEDDLVPRSWQHVADVVRTMPDAVLESLADSVSWWLLAVSKAVSAPESIVIQLGERLLDRPLDPSPRITTSRNGIETVDPVSASLNHPVGKVAQALLQQWFKTKPSDGDLLPEDMKRIFTQLCDLKVDRFYFGRVFLASNLIALFRVDQAWTEKHLLPLFRWEAPAVACAMWAGFLWSPRLHPPLFLAFKPQFLKCASHYAQLGDYQKNFAALLTYVALERTAGYAASELQSAFGDLPQEGLNESARTLVRALEGASEQREAYWRDWILPFWNSVWPQFLDRATSKLAESIVRLVIAAGEEFPSALNAVRSWLRRFSDLHYEIGLLHESGLFSRFPSEALELLNAIIGDPPWIPDELALCLDEIFRAAPKLEHSPAYQRLRELVRRRGKP